MLNDHDFATSEKLLIKAKNLSAGTLIVYYNLAVLYSRAGEYDKAIEELNEAIKINPSEQLIIDALGWTYYWKNDFENAVKYFSKYPEIEASFEDSTQTVPFRARLGMTYLKMGKKKEASVLFAEDKKIRLDLLSGKRSMGAWGNYGNLYYDLAVHEAYSGNDAKAVQYIDSAFHYQFMNLWLYKNDPMFSNLQSRDDFKRVIKKVEDFDQFRKRAFNNALNRMEASKELKDIFK